MAELECGMNIPVIKTNKKLRKIRSREKNISDRIEIFSMESGLIILPESDGGRIVFKKLKYMLVEEES